jgi:hypothetical protein
MKRKKKTQSAWYVKYSRSEMGGFYYFVRGVCKPLQAPLNHL